MTILLKKSFNSGEIPHISEIEFGELAINVPDGKLFLKSSNVDIVEIGGQLERIQDGGNVGWRVRGRNPNTYGQIGDEAIDFSRGYFEDNVGGATGNNSFASGYEVEASGSYSTASGFHTTASGINSFVTGEETSAEARNSFAEGLQTKAMGESSHAEGSNTIALNLGSHAQGKFNIGTAVDTIHETGIGTSSFNRMNALEIYTDGRVRVPELTEALMDDPRSLVTKEALDTKVDISGNAAITGSLTLGDGELEGSIVLRSIASDSSLVEFRRVDDVKIVSTDLIQNEAYRISIYDDTSLTPEVPEGIYTFDKTGNITVSGTPTLGDHLVNKTYVDRFNGELVIECLTPDTLRDYVNANKLYGVNITFALKNDVVHTYPVTLENTIENSYIKFRRLDAVDVTKPELVFEYDASYPYFTAVSTNVRIDDCRLVNWNLSATDLLLNFYIFDGKLNIRDTERSASLSERELSVNTGNIVFNIIHSELYTKNASLHGVNILGYDMSYLQLNNSAAVSYDKGYDTIVSLFNRSYLEIVGTCTIGGGDLSNLNDGIQLAERSTMDYTSGGNIVFTSIKDFCLSAVTGAIASAQNISGDVTNIGPAGFVMNQEDQYGSIIFDSNLHTKDVAYTRAQIEVASERTLVTKEYVDYKVDNDLGILKFTDLSDTPGSMGPTTIGKWLRVDPTGTTLEYVDNIVGAQVINELNDVSIPGTIGDKDYLRYDNSIHQWTNMAPETISTVNITDFDINIAQNGDTLEYQNGLWVNTNEVNGGTF